MKQTYEDLVAERDRALTNHQLLADDYAQLMLDVVALREAKEAAAAELTRMQQERDAAIQRAEEWHEQCNRARKLTDTAIDNQIRIRQEQEAAEAALTRLREALHRFADADPWESSGPSTRLEYCKHCRNQRGVATRGEHGDDCAWLEARSALASLTPKEPSQ